MTWGEGAVGRSPCLSPSQHSRYLDRSVNPFRTRQGGGVDYAHHITTRPSGFLALPTALLIMTDIGDFIQIMAQ